MALFKILKGDSSRISTDTTAFHEGYAYFTPDEGGLYVDAVVDSENKRIRVTSPGGSTEPVYATLLASGWSGGKQTISVSGLTADTNGIVGLSQDITETQLAACEKAGLYVSAQGSGTLTVSLSGDVPSCDIPVVVILLG